MIDGATPREKDRTLGLRCREAATAAMEAVEWLSANREPSARIAILQKQLRRHAVDARRLAVAAERPMSVGVFGASQMGKSFLIGKLITPPERSVKVVFGSGDEAVRQDFLEQVNPAGGDETTGLVTRFSLRSRRTPPGYPVVLRTLREVDIVKILANSFFFDLKGQYTIQTGPDEEKDRENRTPTDETITALAGALRPLRAAAPQPGFPLEAVFEIREYIQRNVRDHLMAGEVGEAYWAFLEDNLPFLDASARVRALSVLWADLPEFNDLYLTLKRALDELGHPGEMFTSLSALADRARGVLHVDALQDLDAASATARIAVVSGAPEGAVVTMPVAVASALTAELLVTLEEAPWEFLTHTDLLDFPGARSRGRKSVWEVLRKPEEQAKHPRSQCFRRGKVAVLFDNYADDLDLNVMLLCKDGANQEVAELSDLVLGWIARTHGATPESRRGKQPALFYCMTKCDTMLGRVVGNDDPVQKRFDNNLRKSFGGGWIGEWTPGTPFRNVFMLRNPGYQNKGFFTYADPAAGKSVGEETGYVPDFQEEVVTSIRPHYLEDALVRTHVEDPELKFDALLALNDGGSTLLAERLAPVCNPDLKYDQIASRAEEVVTALRASLVDFYETGDIGKRVAERVGRMQTLVAALRRRGNEHLIGPFIASFQVEETLVESAYLADRRNTATPDAEAEASIFDMFDDDKEVAPAAGFGTTILAWWASYLSETVPGTPWCARLAIDEEVLVAFVREVVGSAERLELPRQLEQRIDAFTLNSLQLGAAGRRVSIFGSLMLNELINYPGGRASPSNAARFARVQPPAKGAPCGLPENPQEMNKLRYLYYRDWMDALLDLARDNGSGGPSGPVNVAANERLGTILARLGGVPE